MNYWHELAEANEDRERKLDDLLKDIAYLLAVAVQEVKARVEASDD
jgi:hypothetical protein